MYIYLYIYIERERERERKRERRAFMQMRKGGSMESYQASVRREVRGWGQAGRSGRGFPSSGGNGAQFKHQKTKTKEKLSNTSGFRIFFSLSPHYTDQTHHQINYELISPPPYFYINFFFWEIFESILLLLSLCFMYANEANASKGIKKRGGAARDCC